MAAIRAKSTIIRTHPEAAPLFDAVGYPYLRRLHVGVHAIFYVPAAQAIEVVRIAHGRKDLRRWLATPDLTGEP